MGGGLLPAFGGVWNYAVPLFLLADAVALWLIWVAFVWAWPRLPPLFEPTRRDRSWQQSPATAIDADLRAGIYSSAIDYARYRVARVLSERYGVPVGATHVGWVAGWSVPPEAATLLRLQRTLSRASELAARAESPADDFLSRRFRATWARNARALFADALPLLESAVPPLEVGL